MKKRPKPAKAAVPPGGGGYQQPVPVSPRKPPPRRHPARTARAAPVPPGGGGYQQPVPAQKPVARKKKHVRRKLAAPGESCVLDACYAIAGWRPDLDSDDGLFIPAALETLAALGLIAGVMPADLDSDLSRPGLVLGVDLPGPHAVLTTPDGWWSWGELYDPAAFPDAVIGEAWEVTWPRH